MSSSCVLLCKYYTWWSFAKIFYYPCNLYYKLKMRQNIVMIGSWSWINKEVKKVRNFQICFCIFVTIGIILYLVFGIYEKDQHLDKDEERFEYFLGSKKQFITAMSIDLACSFSFFTVLILCLRWYKYGNKGKGEPQSFTMDQKFIWILAGLALFTFITIASNLFVVLH